MRRDKEDEEKAAQQNAENHSLPGDGENADISENRNSGEEKAENNNGIENETNDLNSITATG